MTLQVVEPTQVQTLEGHIASAEALGPPFQDQMRALATQLDGKPVLPLLGAGASVDCGVRLAAAISRGLYEDYLADTTFAHDQNISDPGNLGDVAQAIFNESDQARLVRQIRLNEPGAWPSAEQIQTPFSSYRVLARLVREGLIETAVGFNYDCQSEAALDAEGFQRSPNTTTGRRWRDHAQVITDRATQSALQQRGSYRLYKAHGCAARYRELVPSGEAAAAETIILRSSQLFTWRRDLWIRDTFRALTREHVLLLIGLSGNDPVVAGELETVLSDVFSGLVPDGQPRAIVIDYQPNTPRLRAIAGAGLGGEAAAPGTVAEVSTAGGTTTAAMLVLLGEWLALRLSQDFDDVGYDLPDAIGPRLAALAITGPVMMRWSYLLRPGAADDFFQHVNVQQAAENGYVPLQSDPARTAWALRTRVTLRDRLELDAIETPAEALGDSGFVVKGDKAYMPVGLSSAELSAACRPGGPIEDARAALPHPSGHSLDCILVPNSAGCQEGVSMFSGATVSVP